MSKRKMRIVQNSFGRFSVEERFLGFIWFKVDIPAILGLPWGREYVDDIEECKRFIQYLEERDKKLKQKERIVWESNE